MKKWSIVLMSVLVLLLLSVGWTGFQPGGNSGLIGESQFESCTSIIVGKLDSADVAAYWKLHDDLWGSFTQYF